MIYRKERQTIETLIKEEALLLAKYLRNERKTWTPRISKNLINPVLIR